MRSLCGRARILRRIWRGFTQRRGPRAPKLERVTSKARVAQSIQPFSEIPGPTIVPEKGGTAYDYVERLNTSKSPVDVFSAYREEYGDVVKLDMDGKVTVLSFSPEEATRAFQRESAFPMTALHDDNILRKYFEARGSVAPLFGPSDENWRVRRRALQKDLTRPVAAFSYLPLVAPTVEELSQVAPKFAGNFGQFTLRALLDMFCTIMMGRHTHATAFASDSELDLINDLQVAFGIWGKVSRDKRQIDPLWDEWCLRMDRVVHAYLSLVQKKQSIFQSSQLEATENTHSRPYLELLMERGELTESQIADTFFQLLFAGIDATHSVLKWLILNLAENHEKQSLLREELATMGIQPLLPEHMSDERLPYLSACIRESHRKTPHNTVTTWRKYDKDIVVGGYEIPKGTTLVFALTQAQNDPDLLDGDPRKFSPERWLPESVEARRNTPREVLDNKMLNDPYGFGPRKCLGFRIADVKIKALTSRLIRDWKIELDPSEQDYKITSSDTSFLRPTPFPKLKFTSAAKSYYLDIPHTLEDDPQL